MKKKKRRNLTARFSPETRFELRPKPAVLARRLQEAELARLKERLLADILAQADEGDQVENYRRAAAEAEALAWATPYALLVMPVLFEEKIAHAEAYLRHQALVRARSATPESKAA